MRDPETIAIYEARAAEYEAARQPRHLTRARALGERAGAGPVVDLGSGPGFYSAALGPRPVAMDGAWSMVRRTREVAPAVPVVQADLAALPFATGSLGGGWARATYVHLRSVDVPGALADLHRSLRVGSPVELTFFGGGPEGRTTFADDDFPGRWFSTWEEDHLRDVITGAGFDIDEVEVDVSPVNGDVQLTVGATRARTLPDLVGPGLRLLVCGLNPSLHAADAGVGYVTPGNRYWPAAIAAGLVTRDRDPWHAWRRHGIGMTDLVKRATPRAADLRREELVDGLARLDRLCAWLQPGAVAMVGLAGWRAAADRTARPGWQERTLGGRPVYVLPSTSGLNAATPPAVLADHLRAALRPPARSGPG